MNLETELAKIDERLERVRRSDRSAFRDGSPSYDSASIAIVRLTGLLERSELAGLRDILTEEESRSLRTIRNIISHGGYADMNDDVFWVTVVNHLPGLVRRLRGA